MKNSNSHFIQRKINDKNFIVAVFGSARLEKDGKLYKQIFNLAKKIGKMQMSIVTGGGPGVMEAANAGHSAGDVDNKADSIGFLIDLPHEKDGNDYLKVQKCFHKFSERLEHFMALADVIVIFPGGIGTCLELFYAWQLTQVNHMAARPIILRGKMWEAILKWIKKYLLKTGFICPQDMDNIYIVKNNRQIMKIISQYYEKHQELA